MAVLPKTQYRVVRDEWSGYAVQERRWWWPFWVEGVSNTHGSIEAAERYATQRAKPVVKYLGEL